MSRRAALVAGVAVLVGCGKDDAAAPPSEPSAAEALLGALAAQRAAVAALATADRAIEARTAAGARRLAAALSAEGGRPHDAPQPAAGGDPEAALRAALEAHVAALPALSTRDLRRLGAGLVAGTAADLALLTGRAEAFPGGAT
jgi:hypothetical protein